MHYLSKHPMGIEDAPLPQMPQDLDSKPERPTPPKPEHTGDMEMEKKGAPQRMGAKKDLAKTGKAEAVARLLLSGKKNETQNNLPFALADYQQARKMAPESVQAQEAFQRVKGRIIEDEFRNLMSTGLTALHRDDFDGARSSFLKARELRPASQEVRDALGQVDQTRRLFRLKRHQKEALDAERSEDWDGALAAYTAALEIDPRVRFAVQGKAHSLEMIQISKRIAFYLNKPEVLESDKTLEKAVQLLSDAEGKVPKGSQLKAEQEKLRHLVQTAQIPLTITLESDNLTRVAVYRVGRLGTFLKNDLTLRPGTYTIVGTRNGYRDVRQLVVLKPGQPLRVTIICREKI
jgi:tetratricopeptide (TPR) repeat protein